MANETTQEVARQQPPKDIRALLKSDQLKNAVAAALPKHLTPERFIRIALNATMRQPELLSCTQESLFRALLDLSAYGLEPDGRRAHLIPFKDNKNCVCGHSMDIHKGQECQTKGCDCTSRRSRTDVQLIIDYKGLAELVRRSGDVSYIHADVVYDQDTFSFAYGSDAHLKHVPNLDASDKKLRCAYSYVKLRDGSEDFIVLSLADLKKIRASSKIPDGPAWTNWPDEMNKKSAFRRHSKWLPLSPEIHDIIAADEEREFNHDNAMAGSDLMRVTIPLESLTPSENPNRGHDESMSTAPDPKKVTEEDIAKAKAEHDAKKTQPVQGSIEMTEAEMAAETAKQDEAREKKAKPATAKDSRWS